MRASTMAGPMTVNQFARLGGLARAASMTPSERAASASKAAKARWKKYRKEKQHAK